MIERDRSGVRRSGSVDQRPALVTVLDGCGATIELVGGKAAAIDRLIAWDITVPPTVVITTAAYRLLARQPSVVAILKRLEADDTVTVDEVDAAFEAAAAPAGLAEEWAAAVATIVDPHATRVAVRSSATVEDMGRSSFAGQYRSVLDVDATDVDALRRAVLQVFASLLYPAPSAYRRALGVATAELAMAAMIMPMVPAVRAGVLFTQDPSGPAGTMRVEWLDGSAEPLVSGRATPHVLSLDRASAGDAHGEELPELLAVGRGLADRTGQAQDIEWVWDGARLWVVQARPITAAPAGPDPFDEPPDALAGAHLTVTAIEEMLPGVLPPLRWEVSSFLLEEGFRTMLDRLGVPPTERPDPGNLVRRVHGRAVLDVDRLAGLSEGLPGVSDRLRGLAPAERGRRPAGGHRARIAAIRRRAMVASARRRGSLDADILSVAADDIGGAAGSLTTVPPDGLLRRHLALVDLAVRATVAEMTVAADAGAIVDGLTAALRARLPVEDARRLAAELTVPTLDRTPPGDASAAVFAGPTWDELGTGAAAASKAPDRRRVEEPADELAGWDRGTGSGIGRWLRARRIERLADEATRQLERRERAKSAILRLGGEVRRIHLEVGRRLVADGRLRRVDDVELLTLAELRSALLDQWVPPATTLERRRRDVIQHEQWGPLPADFVGVPEPVGAGTVGVGEVLVGWAASPGRFEGAARRVDDPSQSVGAHEVLVATATDPSWSPLLMRCGAMVIERGGPLSHAAILAREFGVPAVFNVPGAAAALDGRRVRVDGTAGTVRVLAATTRDRERAP